MNSIRQVKVLFQHVVWDCSFATGLKDLPGGLSQVSVLQVVEGDAHSDQGLAAEQAQQSLECAAVAWGGVELEGNPALIKSISQAIESSRRQPPR